MTSRPQLDRLEDRLNPVGPIVGPPIGPAFPPPLPIQPAVGPAPPMFPPALNGVAVGYGKSFGPFNVRMYQNTTTYQEFKAYDLQAAPATAIHVATGDVTGDGVADVVTGLSPIALLPGANLSAAPVRVFDGTTLGAATPTVVRSFHPYGSNFGGGIHVEVADLDGDGKAEVIVCRDEGGLARVKVFSGTKVADTALASVSPVADFEGIDGDPNATAGGHVAAGDMNGDGTPDLVVGSANGPRAAFFDGTSLQAGETPVKLFGDIFAFDPATHKAGIHVAIADLDGDSYGELVAGSRTGSPRMKVFDGEVLISTGGVTQTVWLDRTMGDTASTGGLRIAAKRLDSDARDDLVLSHGTGSKVTTVLGRNVYPATGWVLWPGQGDVVANWTTGVWVG